ncbi:MAG: pyridoxamine 5'-phosphate oxidase family protein [Bacteroidaceae bacterium]|nr:pyridoxamine 5'-phosphate oxidase family protein [Bacteroidaceae bacterium]MBQ8008992.1 pyridoxamine 5'-phosphate oxidase family protein [Bacteroidaceae bacterium]MBR1541775.1 pyridoxamine 5'-phosphate oxidase family protein [Bacteroidaceae bacterium]
MKRALDFLATHKDVAFATCDGNLPKVRVFQIMKQDGIRLYFATSAQKAVYRELKQNPHVELLAYEGNISVRCTATAEFQVDDDMKRWIYEHNEVLPRLYSSYDQMEYFSLAIKDMDYYDLAPTPPIFKHFDLMTGETGDGFVGGRFMKQ